MSVINIGDNPWNGKKCLFFKSKLENYKKDNGPYAKKGKEGKERKGLLGKEGKDGEVRTAR